MNRSTLQVLGCYILWGLLPVFWKLLAGVNAAYVLAQRIVFSCLFCYAFIWIKKDGPAVRAILRDKKQRRLYLCCGLLLYLIHIRRCRRLVECSYRGSTYH